MARKATSKTESTANLGFEAKLWLAADKLRNNMDAAEYKHVVLGLIFLKYISDSFEEHHAKLVAGEGEYAGADPEDPDEYRAENIFWVPQEARWSHLQGRAKQPAIGKDVDDAMDALERDNPRLKGALNKNYGRADLDKHRLGELIDLIGTIALAAPRSGGRESALKEDDAEGGQTHVCLYVPPLRRSARPRLRILPHPVRQRGGQERRAILHAVLRRAPAGGNARPLQRPHLRPRLRLRRHVRAVGKVRRIPRRQARRHQHLWPGKQRHHPPPRHHEPRHPRHRGRHRQGTRRHLPPRPASRPSRRLRPRQPALQRHDWHRKDDDVRWKYGVPPKGNANFAWVQHFIHHLAPHGMAGFVLANGSMSSNQSGEGEIRKALIEADLVDCMVALPGQLFYSTQIPVCLWFLAKNKNTDAKRGFRDRRKQTLFIDARKLGTLIDRVHRELTDADLEKITSAYHAWRGDSSTKNQEQGTKNPTAAYADVAGFCKSATTAEIAAHGHVLTPGRYVGAEEVEDDGDPFEEKMPRLVAELHAQFAESAKLEAAIRANLKSLNFTP